MSCIFCEILEGIRDAHVIYEDSTHLAFLDRYPIERGHSLVIPRHHYQRITQMEPGEVGQLFSIIPHIANSILGATGAVAFSLAQNNGREARQIIPHVHVHIIPRYREKGVTWTKRQIAPDSQLAELAGLIKDRADSVSPP